MKQRIKHLNLLKFKKWALTTISLGIAPLMVWLGKEVSKAQQYEKNKKGAGAKVLLWILDGISLGLAPLSQWIMKKLNAAIEKESKALKLVS